MTVSSQQLTDEETDLEGHCPPLKAHSLRATERVRGLGTSDTGACALGQSVMIS